MIRQAISCDICATEKRQTNNWFVAFEQGGELRVSGFNSRNRLRPGSKHLCGQTCLHKLVDEFMARTIAVRSQPGSADDSTSQTVQPLATNNNASLTSSAAYQSPIPSPRINASRLSASPENASLDHASTDLDEFESSARLISPPASDPPRQPQHRSAPELLAMPKRQPAVPSPELSLPVDEPPRYASRNWRAEAWDRERERERRPDISPRRRAGS